MGSYVELLKACKEGNQKKVKKLLGYCPDIGDVRDLTDKTLLHYCFKYESCVDLILAAAPELLDVGEKNGYTVLHLASMIKPPTSLRYLLSKGPDINKRNNDSRSSILLAVIYDNYEAVKLLCEHNADVNISDISGVSPLHYAAKIKSDTNDEEQNKIIDILLEYKANIEIVDFYDRSPLIWAVCSNNIVKMHHLIKQGANIYSKDAGGLSLLHYATSNGNTEIITILLEAYNFNIETFDNNFCTALMYACSYNNPDVIELLLSKGANVNAEDSKRRNPAHFASGKGDLKNLKILAAFHADLWKLNSDSNYPLHEAAYKGHANIVRYLIENLEPDRVPLNFINHKNSNGQTALHLATVKDNVEICRMLLEHGADPNISLRVSNGKSMTALDLANKEETKYLIIRYNGKTSDDLLKTSVINEELSTSSSEEYSEEEDETESIKSNVEAGNEKETKKSVDADETIADDEKPVSGVEMIDDHKKSDEEVEIIGNGEKFEEEAKLITSVVVNDDVDKEEEKIHESDSDETELEITEEYKQHVLTSCYLGKIEEVQSFIKRGGCLSEITDDTGKTLLHYSLKNKESFELIIKKSPGLINYADNSNLTILHMVIMSQETDRLPLLLENNADFNFADCKGRTALHISVMYNNLEALKVMRTYITDKSLFSHKPDASGNYPLHYAVEICRIKKTICQCKEFIQLLLEMNGDIECRDQVNRTPLLLAININNQEAVSVLLQHGANIMAKDNQNLCSIHYVCSEGNLDIFNKLAVHERFDSEDKDPNGLTPIFYAISSCNDKIVKRLIELGANLELTDQHGRNLCHKAAEKGAFKCLELLLEYNVNPWLISIDGNLPLHEAAYRGYKEIAEMLLNMDSAVSHINVKNNSGQTALHLAAVRNDCPMCFLLISKGSNVNELLHNNIDSEDVTAYDLATTPYCKETLFTFGGRSAKRIIDCIHLDDEIEPDKQIEELALLRRDNLLFVPRPSIRSTELALSTMPSIIYTVRTNEVSNGQKSSFNQPIASSKQSSKKSKTSSKAKESVHNSEKSAVTSKCSINREETPIVELIEAVSVVEKTDNESEVKKSPKELTNSRKSTLSNTTYELSEIYKPSIFKISTKSALPRKFSTRTKSSGSSRKMNNIHIAEDIMKSKIQSSVMSYEYVRFNCKFANEIARQKIREENLEKLLNPKTPKILRRNRLHKPEVATR